MKVSFQTPTLFGSQVVTDSRGASSPHDSGFDEIKEIAFRFEGTDEQKSKWDRWLIDVYKLPKSKKSF